jgi:hypothetical protein
VCIDILIDDIVFPAQVVYAARDAVYEWQYCHWKCQHKGPFYDLPTGAEYNLAGLPGFFKNDGLTLTEFLRLRKSVCCEGFKIGVSRLIQLSSATIQPYALH